MRPHICHLLLFALLLFTPACRHKDNYLLVKQPFIVHKDIVYGADAVQQCFDVWLPQERNSKGTPVIILVHGGAWAQGNKNEFKGVGLDTFFTANGCAVVNMNYRLDGVYPYPDAVDDIDTVLSVVQKNAAIWGVNPDKVCILGKSSGAHLAMLYAYSRNESRRVKVVMDFYGPSDLTDSTVAYKPLGMNVADMLGEYSSNRQRWHDASPLYYMPAAVPTVIFQGTADTIVYYRQSQLLQGALKKHCVPYYFVNWDGKGHGWAADMWLRDRDTAMAWVMQYLK